MSPHLYIFINSRGENEKFTVPAPRHGGQLVQSWRTGAQPAEVLCVLLLGRHSLPAERGPRPQLRHRDRAPRERGGGHRPHPEPGGRIRESWGHGKAGAGEPLTCLAGPGARSLTPLCPQLADVVDSEVLQVYMKPPAHEESRAPSKGFVVRDAPWTASSSEKVRPVRVPLCREMGCLPHQPRLDGPSG